MFRSFIGSTSILVPWLETYGATERWPTSLFYLRSFYIFMDAEKMAKILALRSDKPEPGRGTI